MIEGSIFIRMLPFVVAFITLVCKVYYIRNNGQQFSGRLPTRFFWFYHQDLIIGTPSDGKRKYMQVNNYLTAGFWIAILLGVFNLVLVYKLRLGFQLSALQSIFQLVLSQKSSIQHPMCCYLEMVSSYFMQVFYKPNNGYQNLPLLYKHTFSKSDVLTSVA